MFARQRRSLKMLWSREGQVQRPKWLWGTVWKPQSDHGLWPLTYLSCVATTNSLNSERTFVWSVFWQKNKLEGSFLGKSDKCVIKAAWTGGGGGGGETDWETERVGGEKTPLTPGAGLPYVPKCVSAETALWDSELLLGIKKKHKLPDVPPLSGEHQERTMRNIKKV